MIPQSTHLFSHWSVPLIRQSAIATSESDSSHTVTVGSDCEIEKVIWRKKILIQNHCLDILYQLRKCSKTDNNSRARIPVMYTSILGWPKYLGGSQVTLVYCPFTPKTLAVKRYSGSQGRCLLLTTNAIVLFAAILETCRSQIDQIQTSVYICFNRETCKTMWF